MLFCHCISKKISMQNDIRVNNNTGRRSEGKDGNRRAASRTMI